MSSVALRRRLNETFAAGERVRGVSKGHLHLERHRVGALFVGRCVERAVVPCASLGSENVQKSRSSVRVTTTAFCTGRPAESVIFPESM